MTVGLPGGPAWFVVQILITQTDFGIFSRKHIRPAFLPKYFSFSAEIFLSVVCGPAVIQMIFIFAQLQGSLED